MNPLEGLDPLVAWCNLCRAEGDDHQATGTDVDEILREMQEHSNVRHAEHEAALRRGETYVPVEVDA